MKQLIQICTHSSPEQLEGHLNDFLKSNEKTQTFGEESLQLFTALVSKFTILVQTDHHQVLPLKLLACMRLLTRSQTLAKGLHTDDFEKVIGLLPIITKSNSEVVEPSIIEVLTIQKRLLFHNKNLFNCYNRKDINLYLDLLNYQSKSVLVVVLDFTKIIMEIDTTLIAQEIATIYYLGKLTNLLESSWPEVMIEVANLLTKLLDFQQISDNFRKLAGIGSLLDMIAKSKHEKLEIKIPLLNLMLKASSDPKNYSDLKMYEVIDSLLFEFESLHYLAITTVVNIYGQLAFDEEQANKIMQKALNKIICLLFSTHPHLASKLTFHDLKKADYPIALKELQLYTFRLLRYLASIMRNRAVFKQIFVPRLLQIFIDIGNYNKALNAYKRLVEEFNHIEPEDLLCMQESLKQLQENLQDQSIKRINDYEVLEQIGKGAFGSVFLCRLGSNLYAIKQINGVETLNYREVEIHKDLYHPNIVKLYECFIFQNSLCLIMEYLEGFNLSELIRMKAEKGQAFEQEQIWRMVVDILSVLRYLHVEKKIVHRDLNPANIMVGHDGTIKICDFGLAKHIAEDIINNSFVGTLIYTCPQIVENKGYGEKADIWAFGCILYEILQLRPAFQSANPLMLANKIVQLDFEPLSRQNHPEELINLVYMCLEKEEAQRPSVCILLEKISGKLVQLIDSLKESHQSLSQKLDECWQKQNRMGDGRQKEPPNADDWKIMQKLARVFKNKDVDHKIELFQTKILSSDPLTMSNEVRNLAALSKEQISFLPGVTYEQLYFLIQSSM